MPFWNQPSSLLALTPSPSYQPADITTRKSQATQLAEQGHSYTHQQEDHLRTPWALHHGGTWPCPTREPRTLHHTRELALALAPSSHPRGQGPACTPLGHGPAHPQAVTHTRTTTVLQLATAGSSPHPSRLSPASGSPEPWPCLPASQHQHWDILLPSASHPGTHKLLIMQLNH